MLREIEIIMPETLGDEVTEIIDGFEIIDCLKISLNNNQILWKIIVTAEISSGIMDSLEKRLSFNNKVKINLKQVEAYLPEKEETEDEKKTSKFKTEEEKIQVNSALSRAELYTEVKSASNINYPYLIFVVLSAIVAASGLLQDNIAVIIGAMVIAPLLGPNMGLALAVTLGDFELGKKAVKTNLVGIFIPLIISILIGWIIPVEELSHEILSRTYVGWGDIVLALAAGSAGSLAFTTGVSGAVIGVMIAVALLPPLIVAGILLGAGEISLAIGAFLLLACNIISINLTAIITFNIQGIKPLNWWEKPKAEKALYISYFIWISMLLLLIYIIQFS